MSPVALHPRAVGCRRRQVSWLAAQRPTSTFPEYCDPSGSSRRLAADSCGGSRGFALARTAFPFASRPGGNRRRADYRACPAKRNAGSRVREHDARLALRIKVTREGFGKDGRWVWAMKTKRPAETRTSQEAKQSPARGNAVLSDRNPDGAKRNPVWRPDPDHAL